MRRRALQAFVLLTLLNAFLLAACSQTSIPISSPSPRSSSRSSPGAGQTLPAAPLSVYLGSTDGFLSALDAATGVMRWRTQVSNAPTASVVRVAALAAGALYAIATDIGKRPGTTVLTALRASDGSSLWQKIFVGSGTVVAARQGAVYLALDGNGSVANTIQMLQAQDGAVLWRIQVAGTGPLHASMYDGTIYVTSFTTMLPSPGYYYASTLIYALNASTGAVNWHNEIGRTNYVAAVANSAVYLIDTGTDVVCDPLVLHVLSATDGRERWQASGTLLQLSGVEQGRAYITDVPEGCSAPTYDHIALHALNTDDGSSVWQIDLQSQYYVGLLAYGMIYLPGESNALAAYSAKDGSLLWHVQGENGRLWVFGDKLYTSISGRGLDAISPTTGAVRWRYQTSDQVSLTSVGQGVLYGVSSHQIANAVWNQTVVAFRTNDGKLLWRFLIGAGTDIDAPIVG